MITVTINGQPTTLAGPITVAAYVETLPPNQRHVAVAVNGEVISRDRWLDKQSPLGRTDGCCRIFRSQRIAASLLRLRKTEKEVPQSSGASVSTVAGPGHWADGGDDDGATLLPWAMRRLSTASQPASDPVRTGGENGGCKGARVTQENGVRPGEISDSLGW